MVTCERCDRPIDGDADPHCFIDNEGWCENEIVCEPCRERAFDDHNERLVETGGAPSLIEQQREAWKLK